MGYAAIHNVRYRCLASCVPKNVVSNLDCAPQIKSERERLVRNIGIERRRLCYPWQCFSDLAVAAAERLMGDLQWVPEDVDALVVVTQSPDYLIPATAIIIQDRLKLRTSIPAFDINLGCSGYPYGLYVLGSMMSSGFIKKGLVLIGDKCGAHTVPYIESRNPTAKTEHEATTSKIAEDQLFYCRQRGLSAEEATALIVNGFVKDVLQQLPMEFAVEAQKLISISLEGSVG